MPYSPAKNTLGYPLLRVAFLEFILLVKRFVLPDRLADFR